MSFSGRLLVATPALTEPTFDRTVILLLEHDDEDGALGIVLNRPTDIDADEPVPGWGHMTAAPAVVFVGGPVHTTAAIALGRLKPDVDPTGDEIERAGVVVVDLGSDPDEVAARMDEIRLYAGYAGWGPGQLEDEIDDEAWFVVDAKVGDALTTNPGELWRSVMGRQPGRLSWLGHYPDDVTSN
ncbi:MAG: YqgE/AlgH family protein [Actinomycetota bacterium]